MTLTAAPYAFGTLLPLPPEVARERTIEALAQEGFGLLTEIDVQATLRAKLGVETPAYRILGACNPPLAHRALELEPSIGTLLPCNVVLRAEADGTRLEIMDPMSVLQLAGPHLEGMASEVRQRLERVVDRLRAASEE